MAYAYKRAIWAVLVVVVLALPAAFLVLNTLDLVLSMRILGALLAAPVHQGPSMIVFTNYDTDGGYEDLAVSLNATYCKRHGYEFVNVRDPKYLELPPWWRKVFAMRDLMRRPVDYVMWLDSDAAFAPRAFGIPIAAMFENESGPGGGGPVVHVGRDPLIYGFLAKLNAGVFAVRNDEAGKAFVEEWCSGFDKSKWCPPGEECPGDGDMYPIGGGSRAWKTSEAWAEGNFEQGVLNRMYHSRPGLFRVYPSHLMSNWDHAKLVHHMMGDSSEKRMGAFSRALRALGCLPA